jgi:putative CocE/NonD family hydrolase
MRPLLLALLLASACVLPGGCALLSHRTRASNALPDFTDAPGAWRDVKVPMRDGAKLHTRVLLPHGNDGTRKAPLVVIRNAYPFALVYELECDVLVRYGIGCVVQDVRGRGESEGVWEPFLHEGPDGQDTLAWVLAQPFAGDVALHGASYLGATALSTAAAGPLPPQVKTLVVTVFGADLRANLGERGLLHHELSTAWAAFMPGREGPRDGGAAYRSMLETRPHLEADVRTFGKELPWYRAWLEGAHTPGSPYWQGESQRAFAAVPEGLQVPVLLIGGFDDPFLTSQLETWARLATRERSLFVLAPTNHVGQQSGRVRAEDLPTGLPPARYLVPWLLTHLRGAKPALPTGGVWVRARQDAQARLEADWPPPGTAPQALALSGAPAEGLRCASRQLGGAESPGATAAYTYDPARPWRIAGSARGIAFTLPGMGGLTPGPVELPWECERADVLRFAGAPLTAPLRLAGRASLALTVRSDAPDTAFTAKLVDIDPSGRAVHVSDGVATLRRPTDAEAEVPYAPGSERRVTVTLWPNEWVFEEGHRVALWVSSSLYPTFSLHPNTEKAWYLETAPRVAHQTLELGPGAAQLVLPVVAGPRP